jgi:acetyl esterase
VGGAMAAVVAIRARDEGGPKIAAQVLLYPVTDHYSVQRPSYVERGVGCGLTRDAMMWFWDPYLEKPEDGAHPHASPIRAESLMGLPKAYVVTGEYDLLRDEGEDYAARLRQAGASVDLIRYDDMNHGFLNWVGLVDRSTEAMDAIAAWVRKSL